MASNAATAAALWCGGLVPSLARVLPTLTAAQLNVACLCLHTCLQAERAGAGAGAGALSGAWAADLSSGGPGLQCLAQALVTLRAAWQDDVAAEAAAASSAVSMEGVVFLVHGLLAAGLLKPLCGRVAGRLFRYRLSSILLGTLGLGTWSRARTASRSARWPKGRSWRCCAGSGPAGWPSRSCRPRPTVPLSRSAWRC